MYFVKETENDINSEITKLNDYIFVFDIILF
jgi:hypothetical protein